MFYFIFVIIVFLMIILARRDKRGADKYLIAVLFCFMLDIMALVLYVSKDVYYYNVLNNYFMFPKEVWKLFMYSGIPQNAMIRCMNLFSLLFIYFGVQFAFTFMSDMHLYQNKKIQKYLMIYLIIQYLYYDPKIYYFVYMLVCGNLLEPESIATFASVAQTITRSLNITIIIATVIIIFFSNYRVNKSNFFRGYALGESICYVGVVIAYIFIFWFAPSVLVKVSKLAQYVNYMQVPLTQSNKMIYQFFPYYLTVDAIAILYFIIRYIRFQNKFENSELEIKRQVDAAVVTSRAFCHFMKNELLSIQAEIDMLEVGTENEVSKKQIIDECEYLYSRLDELHHSTKLSELTLKQMDLRESMDMILSHMKNPLQKCTVIKEYCTTTPYVMIDQTCFEQAIHNIIGNSLDAMYKETKEDNHIRIKIEVIDNWIQLSIIDNGKGISEQDINKIFSPFVTSQPIKKHWGIGLTLTYKIIEAHGGKIEVSSILRKETVFKIL